MITVVDQVRPWLTPRSTFAKRIQSQLGAHISMKGTGVEWHLYGVDDCVLSREEIPTRFRETRVTGDGLLQTTITSKANRTNRIEASTNLVNWFLVTNVLNKTGVLPLADTSSTNHQTLFYRARVLQ